MSADPRARLAALQMALVAALTGRAAPPTGFDADRVRAAAAALVTKRRRAVARAWPALATAIAQQFDAYAAATTLPRLGGSMADGRMFLRWLRQRVSTPRKPGFKRWPWTCAMPRLSTAWCRVAGRC